MSGPKLRTGKVNEPYPIGEFPNSFVHTVAGEISAALAVGITDIEGKTWEKIFAKAINAEWKPSVVGLDDILVPALSAAWGAKTVKSSKPFAAKKIRLISGRNSPAYSFNIGDVHAIDPAELGGKVVEIWNERVAALYQKYKTLRTVVLLKGPELKHVTVFEKPTIRFNPEEYVWSWNKQNNLVGHKDNELKFTWQPHGSQFTINEAVPDNALNIEIDPPKNIASKILETIGFSNEHYRIVPRKVASEEVPPEDENE